MRHLIPQSCCSDGSSVDACGLPGSLAWAVERLRRHPLLLPRLTEEVDTGGSELRQATISEVQRTRPVLDATVRCTKARIRLRDWVIPENTI
jgi:hypothetical protein